MVDQWLLRILVSPLALLYGAGVAIHEFLYNIGLMRGVRFNLPVISIGNLTVGGTGKTPHTEYLVMLLREYLSIGILSRGYRRKSTGYREVTPAVDANEVGDEPLQFKRKFPEVHVAVGESRSLAIPQLLLSHPETQVILMDDGFQHREVLPGLNILLTEYDRLYTRDWLLPVGKLREWRSGASRADIIIVSKCPDELSEAEKKSITDEVKRLPEQQVFFSKYIYGNPYRLYRSSERLTWDPSYQVLVVAALADTGYLLKHIHQHAEHVKLMEYRDHHPFSHFDIGDIERHYKIMAEENKTIILTTEKDAMRLDVHRELLRRLDLPIYILPAAVRFLGSGAENFDQFIKDWLLNFRA